MNNNTIGIMKKCTKENWLEIYEVSLFENSIAY